MSIGPWDRTKESFEEYNDRRNQMAKMDPSADGLGIQRYAIAVEHGQNKSYGGECMLHAYVLCTACWTRTPGLVYPRSMVLTGEIMTWLVPQNEDLVLGARLGEVIAAVLKHETEVHRG
jgi:hypothetical protein